MSNSQEDEVSGSGAESDLEMENVPQSLMFGDMLDSVLSRHLEYTQDDNTLSLAEILLLIKQSLDSQNAILSEMLRLKMSKYGATSSGSAPSTHSRQHSTVRQETPEERAIRKARQAAAAK